MSEGKKGNVWSASDANEIFFGDLTREDPWRIFRIIAEFVESFDKMGSVQVPLVTVFGSARTPSKDRHYKEAEKLGCLLAEEGYGVVTGGGPGIMEAANKGARKSGGVSIGLNIDLPMEQKPNRHQTLGIGFRYFFIRKVNFLKYSAAIVVFPGGFGTMDEFFETLTLTQTKKINSIPIILVGSEFWTPLMKSFSDILLAGGYISPGDVSLWKIVDSADDVMGLIQQSHKDGIKSTKIF